MMFAKLRVHSYADRAQPRREQVALPPAEDALVIDRKISGSPTPSSMRECAQSRNPRRVPRTPPPKRSDIWAGHWRSGGRRGTSSLIDVAKGGDRRSLGFATTLRILRKAEPRFGG